MEEIVKKILNENGIDGFEQLIKKYEKMVYGIAYRFLNNKQDAEDITQETFLIVYRQIKHLRKHNSMLNWIYTIALNLTRRRLRKKYQNSHYLMFENILGTNENISPYHENLHEKIRISLEKLSPQQKEAIELKYLKGLKIKEISKIMNCKEGTVKVHLFRGIRMLRGLLKNEKL
ncbi:MAG: RNA polymerase sigma factor [Candidatus Ratteibacteria bacterium]